MLSSLILSIYVGLPILPQEISPVQPASALECAWNSNVLDAKCKCARNQCRLSKTDGYVDVNNSGNNDNKNTGLFSTATYDCFDAGTVLGSDASPSIDTQNVYRGGANLTNEKPDYSCIKNGTIDIGAIKSDLKIVVINTDRVFPTYENKTLRQVCAELVQSGDEEIKGCSTQPKCYVFNSLDARAWPSDEFGNGYQLLPPSLIDILSNEQLLTASFVDSSSFVIYCNESQFYIGQPGVGCDAHCWVNPNGTTNPVNGEQYEFVCKTGCKTVPSPNDPEVSLVQCSEDSGEIYGVDGFYSRFYVDEFNRIPTAQNIPQGSICYVEDGPRPGLSDAYSYWFYPNYFKLIGGDGGELDNNCSPLFTKYDLRGDAVTGTKTFFGCLPNSFNGFISFVIRFAIRLAIIAILIIGLISFGKVVSNPTNKSVIPEEAKRAKGALAWFVFILLSTTILQIIGFDILGIQGSGGNIFRIFVGG